MGDSVFTTAKFLSLSMPARHKKCYELLRTTQGPVQYNELASLLNLTALDFSDFEQLEERFHFHVAASGCPLRETDFLLSLSTHDREEALPFGTVYTYLDSLRSAHNVGSIVRTVEALRLGPIRSGGATVIPQDHSKIKKTSMGAAEFVDIQTKASLETLPRPWIALETVQEAPSLYDVQFSSPCTLIIGNEERGISKDLLEQVDLIVRIPLYGRKNSLNVSCAFAILASYVAHNLQGRT